MLQARLEPVSVPQIKAHVDGLSQPLYKSSYFHSNISYYFKNYHINYLIFIQIFHIIFKTIILKFKLKLKWIKNFKSINLLSFKCCRRGSNPFPFLILRRTSMGSHSPYINHLIFIQIFVIIFNTII